MCLLIRYWQDWRAQITRAGLGHRLPRTIRNRTYPTSGDSINAAAFIWSNAPEILNAHDRGALIRSKSGFWLAIPTEAAGKGPRGARLAALATIAKSVNGGRRRKAT